MDNETTYLVIAVASVAVIGVGISKSLESLFTLNRQVSSLRTKLKEAEDAKQRLTMVSEIAEDEVLIYRERNKALEFELDRLRRLSEADRSDKQQEEADDDDTTTLDDQAGDEWTYTYAGRGRNRSQAFMATNDQSDWLKLCPAPAIYKAARLVAAGFKYYGIHSVTPKTYRFRVEYKHRVYASRTFKDINHAIDFRDKIVSAFKERDEQQSRSTKLSSKGTETNE
jgi:hypothetical protein